MRSVDFFDDYLAESSEGSDALEFEQATCRRDSNFKEAFEEHQTAVRFINSRTQR
jgi:hypothetical protein